MNKRILMSNFNIFVKKTFMKHFFIFFLFSFSILTLPSCKKPPVDPLAETGVVSNITPTTAECAGISNGDKILEKGICWTASSGDPTIWNNKKAAGDGEGAFNATITGLTPNTEYRVRAYCASRLKISYGSTTTFKTLKPAVITTNYPTLITTTSFTSGGVIVSNGQTLASCGICWSTSPNPTVNDNKTTDNAVSDAFVSNPSGLNPNTQYYLKAYAIFGNDIVYGDEISIKTYTGVVTDIDGNQYYTVTIGSQVWMASNLKVTHYRNGNPITFATSSTWQTTTTGKYGYYDDDFSNSEVYGNFYDWLAITDSRKISPVGWHVPSNNEWLTLENYLGGSDVAGGKMKVPGYVYWSYYNTGSTNSSGFSALGGGRRNYDGTDDYIKTWACFWSSSIGNPPNYTSGNNYGVLYDGFQLFEVHLTSYIQGYHLRCIKD
jgi:uncharacterized protein (TIGR02145 family)